MLYKSVHDPPRHGSVQGHAGIPDLQDHVVPQAGDHGDPAANGEAHFRQMQAGSIIAGYFFDDNNFAFLRGGKW